MDLSDFLTEEEIRHYSRFLGAGFAVSFIAPDRDQPWTWTATTVAPGQQRSAVAELEQRETADVLLRSGFGPDAASSSQELALAVQWSWDVCGYYSRLGLTWKATRGQIKEALQRLGALDGDGKADLVYAASQLLNDDTRRRYDRTPLGTWFLEDKDVEEMFKRAAQQAASAMAARGYSTTAEDILGDWGIGVTPRGGPQGEGREGYAQPPPPPPPPGPGPFSRSSWQHEWSWWTDAESKYFLAYPPNRARLAQLERWQMMLVRAFARRGMAVRFAVGLDSSETFSVRPTPDQRTLVALLGRGEPTQEMAELAADTWGLARQTQS